MIQISLPIRLNQKERLIKVEGFNSKRLTLRSEILLAVIFEKLPYVHSPLACW